MIKQGSCLYQYTIIADFPDRKFHTAMVIALKESVALGKYERSLPLMAVRIIFGDIAILCNLKMYTITLADQRSELTIKKTLERFFMLSFCFNNLRRFLCAGIHGYH